MTRFFTLIGLILTLVGCGSAAPQPTFPTPTPNPLASSGIVDKSGSSPGLFFTHPAGWQLLESDARGLMVYSAPDAGLRLFSPGLVVGEVVVQVSATPRGRVESDLINYIISLAELTDVTYEAPQPITINGFDGYQLIGERPEFTVVLTITEQGSEFVEVVAYTHPSDAEAQRPVIDSIITSAIWKVPTE